MTAPTKQTTPGTTFPLRGPNSGTPARLHELISAFFAISRYFLGWVFAFVAINWSLNFLHAPIGIKDNPPEPGIIVHLAQLALIPALVFYFALRELKYYSREYGSRFALFGFAGLVITTVGGTLLAGEFMHREFIPGTHYFWNAIVPILCTGALILFAGALLVIDGVFAYAQFQDAYSHFGKWQGFNSVLTYLATLSFAVSTLSGAIGVIQLCVRSSASVFIISAALLFMFGVGFSKKINRPAPKAI